MSQKTAPIELIRKIASAQAFDEYTRPEVIELDTYTLITCEKLATVADAELFAVAARLTQDQSGPDSALECYESLGGKYKNAFGAPMFNVQQMAGSPALSGGMSRRSTTTMPVSQQAQPVKSPATSSPRSQSQGGSSTPSVAPSTPSASTPAPAAPPPTVSVSMG